MQADRQSKVSRTSGGFPPYSPPGGGAERLVLGLALLLPLAVIVLALAQLPGTTLASPPNLIPADPSSIILGKRPASSNPAPPPTLAPPTATPRPTATPVPPTPTAQASATPQKGGTYTVKPGDELRHIAAEYHVSIWKIIAANDIPNPDSLKIGQELKIPPE
jgi:LysM repeat protein